MTPKGLELRARRAAERRGLRLKRSPRRDPAARDFGRYMLEASDGSPAFGSDPHAFSATLDEVLAFLGRSSTPAPETTTTPPAGDLLSLAGQWFRDRPERMLVCNLPPSISDPDEAARLLFAGDIPDARVVVVARNVRDLLDEAEPEGPSAIGDAIRRLLDPIAGPR